MSQSISKESALVSSPPSFPFLGCLIMIVICPIIQLEFVILACFCLSRIEGGNRFPQNASSSSLISSLNKTENSHFQLYSLCLQKQKLSHTCLMSKENNNFGSLTFPKSNTGCYIATVPVFFCSL